MLIRRIRRKKILDDSFISRREVVFSHFLTLSSSYIFPCFEQVQANFLIQILFNPNGLNVLKAWPWPCQKFSCTGMIQRSSFQNEENDIYLECKKLINTPLTCGLLFPHSNFYTNLVLFANWIKKISNQTICFARTLIRPSKGDLPCDSPCHLYITFFEGWMCL